MGKGFEPTLQIARGWLVGKHVFLREHLFLWKHGFFGSIIPSGVTVPSGATATCHTKRRVGREVE